jgi:hypothetical protein
MDERTGGITELIDPNTVKKTMTFNFPLPVWRWLKTEAVKRETDMTSILVQLVEQEQTKVAA